MVCAPATCVKAFDCGTAALHILGEVALVRRQSLIEHCACYRANAGIRGEALPMTDLIARQTAGNAPTDCCAVV